MSTEKKTRIPLVAASEAGRAQLEKTPFVTDNSDWIKTVHAILDASFGMSKFNQAIPLIISSIAIGVSLVNRNFPKCIGHIVGGSIVVLITVAYIAYSEQPLWKQFSTAFVWYTIFYVLFCMQSSKTMDDNSFIGIMLSFIILVFVDFLSFMGGDGVRKFWVCSVHWHDAVWHCWRHWRILCNTKHWRECRPL